MKWLSFAFRSLLAVTLSTAVRAVAPLDPEKPLNEVPFVMSHGSASAYIEIDENFRNFEFVKSYAKTQQVTFSEQLNCGARAFDLKPADNGNNIVFASAFCPVDEITFAEAIQEILDWSSESNELILLKIQDCDGCNDQVDAILEEMKVSYIKQCDIFNILTVAMTYDLYGKVVAIDDSCFFSNHSEEIGCNGFMPNTEVETIDSIRACLPVGIEAMDTADMTEHLQDIYGCLDTYLTPDQVSTYSCWMEHKHKRVPFVMLSDKLNEIVSRGPPSDGKLWQLTSHWEQSTDSMIIGTFQPLELPLYYTDLEASSALEDSEKSMLNFLILQYIKELVGIGIPLNLVAVDDVCDPSARQLIDALRPTTPEENVDVPIRTRAPTVRLTDSPTISPSVEPTDSPTDTPTDKPTISPSMKPTDSPTVTPTDSPTLRPSMKPTESLEPSSLPSEMSSGMPSGMPSSFPSGEPSGMPSGMPSSFPSGEPSGMPSGAPSLSPSLL